MVGDQATRTLGQAPDRTIPEEFGPEPERCRGENLHRLGPATVSSGEGGRAAFSFDA